MGWSIITNNKDKWELISSVTDSVIVECKTEQELKQYIAMEAIYDGKLKAIQRLMTYPIGWVINDKINVYESNKTGSDSYYEWLKIINNETETYEEYYGRIDSKLEELLIKGGDINE